MSNEQDIINQIVKRHGETINVLDSPQTMIDILRRFGPVFQDPGDGGAPPGGTPPSPPPGPVSMEALPTIADVMKELLKLSRAVDQLQTRVGGVQQG